MALKRCNTCKIKKQLLEFYRSKDCKHGRRPDCKDCCKKAEASRRKAKAVPKAGFWRRLKWFLFN